MKKSSVETDIAGLIGRVMEQIALLEKKVDTLIAHGAARPAETRQTSAPFRHTNYQDRHGQGRGDGSFRDRVLHKAVCADCSKECEVPFKPSGNRPVYCKECFAKRRDDSPFKSRPSERSDGGPRHHGSFKARHDERSGGGEGREKAPFYKKFAGKGHKSGERKKPAARGRKKSK